MTKNREKLIELFKKWLDTNPSRPFAEYECATIAEDFAIKYGKYCAEQAWLYARKRYVGYGNSNTMSFDDWWDNFQEGENE